MKNNGKMARRRRHVKFHEREARRAAGNLGPRPKPGEFKPYVKSFESASTSYRIQRPAWTRFGW
jgi:hypothetical protein